MPKLPEYDKFKAPWEKDLKEGEEPTIDPEALKRHLYNLMSDKEKAQEARTTAEQERDAAKNTLADKTREGESDADKKARELKEANDKADKAQKDALDGLRWKVALDKGLTAVQAKRLVGTTEEELVADADALVKDLGITTKKGGEEEEEESEETPSPRTTPRNLRNAGDPAKDTPNFDPSRAADDYFASRGSF